MKKNALVSIAGLMIGCLVLNSCVGSFGLFNKLASWNKRATKSKFLNEIIFLVISPAYAVCSVVDVLVLNTIEFWSGSNPMAANVGKTKNVIGKDGKTYAVKTLKNGYEITKPDGKIVSFIYDKKTDSWSQEAEGKKVEVFKFNKDGSIQANLQNGRKINVTLDAQGEYETRMAVNGGTYFAMR